MDEGFYRRQADQERKRLEGHQRKVADADKAIAKSEADADKATSDAARASSEPSAKNKRSQADRHRKAAGKARDDRAKASRAAADSQAKIHAFEKKAGEAATKQSKKSVDDRRRQADREQRTARQEQREREREERTRAARDAAREREVTDLRARTDELEVQLRAARLAAPKRICVLFIAGTIEGGAQALHLDREIREVDKKIQASEHRDQIHVETLQATQVRDVIDGLNRYDPDVVHFSGHADHDVLFFEGSDGRPHELRDEQLALLLQVARKPIRLVVLNACLSAQQAALATDFVDAAIGMEESIDDDTAKEFAGQLYASLGAGNSLQSAFDQARVQAQVVSDDDEGRPRLFVRDGVQADQVVLVSP